MAGKNISEAMVALPVGNAICYSGYRRGQSPAEQRYPTREQIAEDLALLRDWPILRLYDCSEHARRVLDVIRQERLDHTVMLGAYLGAERSNPGCPWGADYTDAQLAASTAENEREVDRLIELAAAYEDIVFSVAVGNEATVSWTDHLVSTDRMIEHVRRVRRSVVQPVTVCENYVPWLDGLAPLAAELDFICLHTYPVWEYKGIAEALDYTKDNYWSVARTYPGKPVAISEAGWTTRSNGRGIQVENASEDLQARYCAQLMEWTRSEGILTFVFEAFDEPWKGSPDPDEPEKHWGLYTVDRRPKRVMSGGR